MACHVSEAVQDAYTAHPGRLFTALAITGVGAAGVLCVFAPVPVIAAFAGIAALAALAWYVGAAGALAVLPASLSFGLLVRFDQGFAPIVAQRWVLVMVWAPALCLLLLAGTIAIQPDRQHLSSVMSRFPGRFALGWLFFSGLAALSIVVNRFFDPHIIGHNVPGQLLVLASTTLPVCFAFLLPLSNLSKKQTQRAIWILLGLAAFSGAIMIVSAILPDLVQGIMGWSRARVSTDNLTRGRLPLGHPNLVAATLVLFVPAAICIALHARTLLRRASYSVIALLLIGGILFSLSRMGLIAMTAGVIMALAWSGVGGKSRRSFSYGLVFVVGLLVAAAVLSQHYDFGRFWSKGYYETESVNRRLETWQTASVAFRDHPFIGIGIDSLYQRVEMRPNYMPDGIDSASTIHYYKGKMSAVHPHNLFINVAVEYGILGVIALAWLFYSVFAGLASASRARHVHLPDKAYLFGIGLGLVAILLMGMTETLFMNSVRMANILWVVIGLAMRYAVVVTRGDRDETAAT